MDCRQGLYAFKTIPSITHQILDTESQSWEDGVTWVWRFLSLIKHWKPDCQILTTVACWRCLTGSVRSGGIHPEIKVKTLFFCSSVRLWVWSCSLVEITFNWPISVDLICSVQWILIRISYHHCVACCLHNEKNLQATASFIDHYFQCVTWRWFVQGQILSSRIQNSSSRFKSCSV